MFLGHIHCETATMLLKRRDVEYYHLNRIQNDVGLGLAESYLIEEYLWALGIGISY